MSEPLVRIGNLRVELGGKEILRGVNADLARGRITALIGLNGSGKTTLLRAILREIPFRGRIEFLCGHDHRLPTPQHIGYVPQKLHIDARLPLTVADLLAMSLERRPLFFGIRRRTRKMLADLLAQVWTRDELLDTPVESISGGELQRVLLALALKPDPELLLLDEPAQGIDYRDQTPFYELIAQLNRDRGVTVLLVSHDVSMVSTLVHHVLCMKDGRIQCEGPPHTIPEMLVQTFGDEKGLYEHEH
jgi:zinc transport system ATP-binding protein